MRKFIPEWKKEFKWLEDTANGVTCNVCKSFEEVGVFHSLVNQPQKFHNF